MRPTLWCACGLLLLLGSPAAPAGEAVKGATKILATMSGGGGTSSASATAAAPRGATVTARALNVRSGPGTGYRIKRQVKQGDRLQVLRQAGKWFEVLVGGVRAWVHGDYLKLDQNAGGTGTGSGSGTGSGGSAGSSPDATGTAGPASADPSSAAPPTKSRAGFIQLPNSGPGYYGYYPASKRWGTPRLVYAIQRVALRFRTQRPGAPRVGVGDISLQNGGPIAGHASHQRGVDVDVTPMRNDGQEWPRVTIFQSAYSRQLTQEVMDLFVAEVSVRLILFNDTRTRHTQRWPNHDNHFHLRSR